MIVGALIGLAAFGFLLLVTYLAVFEVRLQRRMRRASWDLENARPGYLRFDREEKS